MKGAIIIEGHIQGLANTRSLGLLGVPVIVIDTKKTCIARFSRYCHKYFHCPDYASDLLAEFLENLAVELDLSGWMILPSNDHAVMTLARNQERLQKHYRWLGPDHDTACKIYDKLTLMHIALMVDVPAPHSLSLVNGFEDPVVFPCIIKGRKGLTFYKIFGVKALICNSLDELKKFSEHPAIVSDPDLAMVQEIIIPPEGQHTISVATFASEGEVMAWWMGRKVREHPWRFGTATLTESVLVEDLKAHTQALMRALNFTGVAETEFLFDGQTGLHKLIEINARTWLWSGHAAACGVDFAALAYNYAMNKPIIWPGNYTVGVKWRNFYTDFYYGMKAIISGKTSLSQWLRQSKGKKIAAVWSPDDPCPFIAFTFLLPIIALQRVAP